MSTRKSIDERIEAAKAEREQMEARIKELQKQQKAQERKDRNHRFCVRGGKLEKLLPELAQLSEEQFEIFVKRCLLTNYTRGVLVELAPPKPAQQDGIDDIAQGEGNAETHVTVAATHGEQVSAPKPPEMAHNHVLSTTSKAGDAQRVAS